MDESFELTFTRYALPVPLHEMSIVQRYDGALQISGRGSDPGAHEFSPWYWKLDPWQAEMVQRMIGRHLEKQRA